MSTRNDIPSPDWLLDREFEKHERLRALLLARHFDTPHYWKAVGNVWTHNESLFQDLDLLDELWSGAGHHDASMRHLAMSRDDRERFRTLPETLTVWRGCYRKNLDRQLRLAGAGTKALVRIMAAWNVNDSDAAILLDVSETTWEAIRSGTWDGVLNEEQMTRASAMIGLYKALHEVFRNDLADRWPGLENRGPLFGGQSPLDVMARDGIPRMIETRRHVEAIREGY